MYSATSGRAGCLSRSYKAGFTLMEVILVLVIVVIISAVSLPYFAGAYKGTKLRSATRTISRMTRYARSMAIMRETTMTVVLNHETMELFLGSEKAPESDSADGEIDQDVLNRLGYTGGKDTGKDVGIEKEIHRYLPEGLTVREFEKEWTEEDDFYPDFYFVRYYPNGQSDWFSLELEDKRKMGVKMENDPVSGKIRSEFTQ